MTNIVRDYLANMERIPPQGYPFKDDFGRYCLRIEECGHCLGPNQFCVQYATNAQFIDGIDISKTIIKKTQNSLCITNGCYAKFHRQMAHIQHKMRGRG